MSIPQGHLDTVLRRNLDFEGCPIIAVMYTTRAQIAWQPQSLRAHPLFAPLHAVLQGLGDTPPSPQEWSRLAAQHPLYTHNGLPIEFVPQPADCTDAYEAKIAHTGKINTRINSWHDAFNAMVWLTFPHSKAAMNARHLAAQSAHTTAEMNPRGRTRDTLTLLDETGVIFASTRPHHAHALQHFAWSDLFIQQRDAWGRSMNAYIIGHGLYEKALTPYIGMTGNALIIEVEEAFFEQPYAAQIAELDHKVAAYIQHPEHMQNPRELTPLPVLGVPNWHDTQDADFYANTAYFRAGRRA